MTLVVARKHNQNIKFLSDSKITDNFEVRNNALSANLKTYILHPYICMSFSGNVHFAEKFLENYYSNKLYAFANVLSHCLELNIESNNSTHFALALLDSNNTIKLF